MKRLFFCIYLLFIVRGFAQEPDTVWLYRPTEQERIARLQLLDSLAHAAQYPFDPGGPAQQAPHEVLGLHPVIPLGSIFQIVRPIGRSGRIYVINNSLLQVGRHITITNGQAWLWAPYPQGYQDARTLSMPLP